jgi:hypothetical protein
MRATILETPAENLVGLGLKLAAVLPGEHDMDEQKYQEQIGCVLADLQRLTGETFPGADPETNRWWLEADEDEDEDEGVAS